jgi:hypothetical protein
LIINLRAVLSALKCLYSSAKVDNIFRISRDENDVRDRL